MPGDHWDPNGVALFCATVVAALLLLAGAIAFLFS